MEVGQEIERAAALIAAADALLITAGAGIGVDSGLPDFRGAEGFWKAYPALGAAGLRFEAIASPESFRHDPALAWGFYGHRLECYRATVPHDGFRILRTLGERLPHGSAVFTSNVDGHFQAAGFASGPVLECHGSIHHLQCLDVCSRDVWPADGVEPRVDTAACRMLSPLPRCPHCGGLARPNILMFGDGEWIDDRVVIQHRQLERWLAGVRHPVVIEIGAGTAIPSVRRFGEQRHCPLIRINPRQPDPTPPGGVSIASGALDTLRRIAAILNG